MKLDQNKKGFTLVELIVVVCIFGIILGAILNIIRPTNEIYNDADETMHTNTIGSGLAEYVDDELRYSTNILILENFAGVPEVSTTGKVGNCDCQFTNCLVFDNQNLRGANLKNYTGDNDTVAKRMGATGNIIKVSKLNTEGFNFNNSVVCKGVDFYDKYKFEFNKFDDSDVMIDNQTIDLSANLNNLAEGMSGAKKFNFYLKVQAYVPRFENGAYHFEKSKYKKLTTIDLININIDKDDNFKLMGDMDFNVLKSFYSTVKQETAAPADATASQQRYYDTADTNTYTYIFYKKETSANASTFSIRWMRSASDPENPNGEYQAPTKVKKGTTYKTIPIAPKKTGFQDPYWLDEDGNRVDSTTGIYVDKDREITVVYVPESPKQLFTVKWYTADESSYTETQVYEGEKPTSPGNAAAGLDNTKEVVDWVLKSDNSKSYGDVQITSNNFEFVPVVKDKHKVEFKPDGTNVDDSFTYYVSDGATAAWPDPTNLPTPPDADHIFEKFVLEGTDDEMSTLAVTSDCVFVAVFKEKPSVPPAAGDEIVWTLHADPCDAQYLWLRAYGYYVTVTAECEGSVKTVVSNKGHHQDKYDISQFKNKEVTYTVTYKAFYGGASNENVQVQLWRGDWDWNGNGLEKVFTNSDFGNSYSMEIRPK